MKFTVKKQTKRETPEEMEVRIRQTLDRLADKTLVVLGLVASSQKTNPPYKIRLGTNNTVFCECNGYKYRQSCRHMERFRHEHTVQVFE